MITHLNIKVYGDVQGVSFRYHTVEMAQQLGLTGFVRNEPDGSVYIEAEGPSEKLGQLIQWCQSGPNLAQVSRLEQNPGPVQNFSGFEITR